jgi:hypothetical protein
MTRRAFATGVTVAAGAAVMRNIINAEDSPQASPEAQAAKQLLLRIETFSPMLPAQNLIAVPEFSLFDDGSIYALGPQLAIFPPPALPNLTLTRITPEAAQSLVAAARSAGLDESRRIASSLVLADAPTTYISFFDGEEIIVSSAAGLLILTERPYDWDETTWEHFLELRSIVSLLIGWTGTVDASSIVVPERSVDPDRMQIVVYRSTNSFALVSDIPNIEQPPLVWPLTLPLTVIAGPFEDSEGLPKSACTELSGDDLASVIAVAQTGDMHSPWTDPAADDDDALYGVLMKPLLPDQTACEF